MDVDAHGCARATHAMDLRLSEFSFEIHYRPGRVHQVPDALLRVISPSTDNKPMDDEIPTFGDYQEPALIITRSKTRASGTLRGEPCGILRVITHSPRARDLLHESCKMWTTCHDRW